MKTRLVKVSENEYATKLSAKSHLCHDGVCRVKCFWRPGNIYASGITGLVQVVTTLIERGIGVTPTFSVLYYAFNIPLLVLAWFKISRKFTLFTLLTVTLTSIAIAIVRSTDSQLTR